MQCTMVRAIHVCALKSSYAAIRRLTFALRVIAIGVSKNLDGTELARQLTGDVYARPDDFVCRFTGPHSVDDVLETVARKLCLQPGNSEPCCKCHAELFHFLRIS